MRSLDPWQKAGAAFRLDLSKTERAVFDSADYHNVNLNTNSFLEEGDERKKPRLRITYKLDELYGAMFQFGEALDRHTVTYSIAMTQLWGSLRVLLFNAQFSENYFDHIIGMLVRIGSALPKSTVYQEWFRTNPSLLQFISRAYIEVVGFCQTSTQSLHQLEIYASIQAPKNIWKSLNQQFEERLEWIRIYATEVEKEAKLVGGIKSHRKRASMKTERERQERSLILSKVSELQYISKHQSERQKHQIGTCSWFLERPEYQVWKKGAELRAFWCHGTAGSGKTVLMSSIVDALAGEILERDITQPVPGPLEFFSSKSPNPAIVYHYCDVSEAESLKAIGITKAFIQQLLQLFRAEDVPASYRQHLEDDFVSSSKPVAYEALTPDLWHAISLFSHVYIFIDGLDQCQEEDIATILSLVERLLQTSSVMLFSRHNATVSHFMARYQGFELTKTDTLQDINHFITAKVKANSTDQRSLFSNLSLQNDVTTAIQKAANGSFLLVKYQLQYLFDAASGIEVRERVAELPSTIDEVYANILISIASDPEKRALAQHVFKWIIGAKRPMKLSELKEALATKITDSHWNLEDSPPAEHLLEACGGLVLTNTIDGTVRLAHHTIQAFLGDIPKSSAVGAFHISLPEINIEIGQVCVSYLNLLDFELQSTSRSSSPTECISPDGQTSASLAFDITEFARLKVPIPDDLRIRYQVLGYAVQNWISHTFHFSDSLKVSWDQFRRLALEKRLRFDFRPWEDLYWDHDQPHHDLAKWAIENEHLPLLRLLPTAYDVGASLFLSQSFYNLEVTRLLLSKGADIQAMDALGSTALTRVASRGDDAAVEMLLANGADCMAQDSRGHSAFMSAIYGDHKMIVERLLRTKEAELGMKGARAAAVLTLASGMGHVEFMNLFLDRCDDLEGKNDYGDTALMIASLNGRRAAVQLLLDKGADVRSTGGSNAGNALLSACIQGQTAIAELLVAKGADVNATQKDGNTALMSAASRNSLATVEFLVSNGAKIEMKDNQGSTALMLAVQFGHEPTVQLLLEKGANANDKHSDGTTVLMTASRWDNLTIIELLLAKGADIEAKNNEGINAIMCASREGRGAAIELLLAKGADIEAKDPLGLSALDHAMLFGHPEEARILLSKESEPNVRHYLDLYSVLVEENEHREEAESPGFTTPQASTSPFLDPSPGLDDWMQSLAPINDEDDEAVFLNLFE